MQQGIQCIIGLGNPGGKYQDNRHNVGFWFVDELARRYSVSLRPEGKFFGETGKLELAAGKCWLLKPMTYMNRSGKSANALTRFYRISPENILVVHDELDLPAGAVRLKQGGGHGGHNGLRDIISALGSRDFWRLRLGIDHPGHRDKVTGYVLSRPSREDQHKLELAIDTSADHIDDLLKGDFQKFMNQVHSRGA
ncbi:aminoacyl-tRNA hydrolase [Thiolapillus brandeum]|uniref:Peptidyl-tRNA hydrolase n=1 Tax=Thiolapillus brandeum TaxID=1076588 RepID=A0A7U6GGJ7_9GAMM|nr:aminoacyl-tRNA hydrolase [Thiolapillus brandeum]BAO43227.1 peptidyl-tRNA hydrolase PTH1 family [Thiolapillus brandeum]